jgi:geranylgeranyl diphosphate synthase type II
VSADGDRAAVRRSLGYYRPIVRREMFRYLPVQEPARYLYELLPLYPQRGGKGLRPSLCLAACEAFGGSIDDALGPAVAFELIHNAFLIHDDVEDESELRRGSATMHRSHGVPLAVNTGDALTMLSLRPILDSERFLGSALTVHVFREFEHLMSETVEGQAIELGWRFDNKLDITETDYLNMILKKTC